jgi:hypothetical protein
VARQRTNVGPTEQEVRERAYEIYLARGCQDGQDISDWLTAERELEETYRESAHLGPAPASSTFPKRKAATAGA